MHEMHPRTRQASHAASGRKRLHGKTGCPRNKIKWGFTLTDLQKLYTRVLKLQIS